MIGNQDTHLPKGWDQVPLEEICLIIQGQSPPGNTYNADGKGLPFFQGKAEFGELYPTPVKWCTAPSKIAEHDDILISIRAPVGPTNLCPSKACIGRGLAAIRPRGGVDTKYVLYGLRLTVQMLLDESTGSTFDAISGQTLREHLIVLAPSAEQLRIVAEIEKQFTRLDAGLAGLKRVQANLKRYRAAVLKAACEGRLVPTEAELARREGRCYEPASILLDRILAERRSGWEAAQLAKSKSVGKLFQDESWKQLYRQPSPPNTSGFEELPEGWTRASIGQVADCLDGRRVPINKQERTKRGGNIPYYGANGPVGTIDDYLFDEPLVLVVEDETFVGRTLPFSYLIKGPSWVNNHAHVLRATSAVLPEFLNYSLMFYPFTPLTTGSTGRRKLTQKALMSAPYPLPPLAEQTRIVAEIERLLSTVDKTMEAAGSTLGRSNTMRHGILRSAFEGKLVLQDPNDEPASVLLERIRSTGTLGRVSSDRKIRATAQFAHASRKK